MMRSSPGVSIQPMVSPLTRMRWFMTLYATFLVSVISAPLEAQ